MSDFTLPCTICGRTIQNRDRVAVIETLEGRAVKDQGLWDVYETTQGKRRPLATEEHACGRCASAISLFIHAMKEVHDDK